MTNFLDALRGCTPMETQHATIVPKSATPSATTPQPDSLKAAAQRVLERNRPRNDPATGTANKRNTRATATMDAQQEAKVCAWLAHIGEADPATIAEVLENCRADTWALRYFLNRAKEVSAPEYW